VTDGAQNDQVGGSPTRLLDQHLVRIAGEDVYRTY
jgi:hypothetical protein